MARAIAGDLVAELPVGTIVKDLVDEELGEIREVNGRKIIAWNDGCVTGSGNLRKARISVVQEKNNG